MSRAWDARWAVHRALPECEDEGDFEVAFDSIHQAQEALADWQPRPRRYGILSELLYGARSSLKRSHPDMASRRLAQWLRLMLPYTLLRPDARPREMKLYQAHSGEVSSIEIDERRLWRYRRAVIGWLHEEAGVDALFPTCLAKRRYSREHWLSVFDYGVFGAKGVEGLLNEGVHPQHYVVQGENGHTPPDLQTLKPGFFVRWRGEVRPEVLGNLAHFAAVLWEGGAAWM